EYDRRNHFPGAKEAVPQRPLSGLPDKWTSLGAAFVHQALATPNALFAPDGKGGKLDYGTVLRQAVGLALLLAGKVSDAKCVGVIMPPLAPTAVANIALTLLGKVPVNLNFANQTVTDSAIRQCKITHVIACAE